MVNWVKVNTFLIILIGLTASVFGGLYIYFDQSITMENLTVFTASLMFTPLISSILTERIFKDVKPIFPLTVKLNRYFLFAVLAPVVFVFLLLGLSLLIPGNEFGFNVDNTIHRSTPFASFYQIQQLEYFYTYNPLSIGTILLMGLFMGILPSTLLAYGEERGWRGFLSKELESLGFWRSSFICGFIWGLWHAPLIYFGYNFPDHPIFGILLMGISCALISPWMVYLTNKANHPLAAALFHGSFNGVIGISISFMSYNNDLLVGPFALSGILLLIPLNVILYYIRKKTEVLPATSI